MLFQCYNSVFQLGFLRKQRFGLSQTVHLALTLTHFLSKLMQLSVCLHKQSVGFFGSIDAGVLKHRRSNLLAGPGECLQHVLCLPVIPTQFFQFPVLGKLLTAGFFISGSGHAAGNPVNGLAGFLQALIHCRQLLLTVSKRLVICGLGVCIGCRL